MISKFISFKNFHNNKASQKTKVNLKNILGKKSEILKSLSNNYKINGNIKKIKKKFKNYKNIRLIGMGGSILGSKAIYSFLKDNIKKNLFFIDNLNSVSSFDQKKKYLNLIISKSGNTLETISNVNVLIKKKDKNIFITEDKKSYLLSLAQILKSEVVHHNNYIGGRYSVLSEVGMLPADLMGLDPKKFRQLNSLIKNRFFFNALLTNVDSITKLYNKKKSNSIILNYDPRLENFLEWYKQLIGESLGKKGKGIQPIISNMPKDNHSVMQLYLDGLKNNFYSFFFLNEKKSHKLKKNYLSKNFNFLKEKTLNHIIKSQKLATEKVFSSKKIPFRSFEILNRDEKTLGELFIFFILETILLGKALNVNPYDQPSVELIKQQTKKILIK
jgi:glucose-6-phosphate isomerase